VTRPTHSSQSDFKEAKMVAKTKILDNGGGSGMSLANNNAAKDDSLTFGNGIYSTGDLLANDPGSAKFVGFVNADGSPDADITRNPDGTFLVKPGVTHFSYEIQVGNGTYSIANVDVSAQQGPVAGPELVNNWSFEQDQTTSGGAYAAFQTLPGWNTDVGSAALEVVSKGCSGIQDDGHWLDTQASPGPIDISQVLNMTAGEHAQMAFQVAAEDIAAANLTTSANEVLKVNFGGETVAQVTLDDFRTGPGGAIDYNNFHTFYASVVGGTDDTLRLVSSGASNNVGFAVDSVSVKALVMPHV
jgi:hypothetical protein